MGRLPYAPGSLFARSLLIVASKPSAAVALLAFRKAQRVERPILME